ncbi:hypothetical protein [Streptomyces sp. NPDC008150]|uniref:hypothetical protein n=1 Tax=Streptomyces sp. NPDC008150 TaxID=3364816 RepID=UPI0036EC381F
MTAIALGPVRRSGFAGAVCALVVAAVTGLAGCGGDDPDAGTNGVGRLSAAKIQARAQNAARTADAVRLSGTVVSDGRTYTLDMGLTSGGGSGSVTSKGVTFHLLRVDEELYLKADADFWTQADGRSADGGTADKLGGKYVKVPSSDATYKRFSGFTDKDVLLGGLLTLHGTLAKDGHHEQGGTRTVRITGDKGSGGTLDVSLRGRPYPLRLERAGGAGTLSFSGWGKHIALDQPPASDTVDLGQQLPAS